jgi:hypothetical protein
MDRCVGAAAMPGSDRKDLAVQVLAGSATVSDLSAWLGVSRKFVYQQANKARCALDDAFISAVTDDTVLFQIQVTKRWLRQVIVALALMFRGSYLGILEFMRDVLSWPISIGTVHNVLHAAAEQARVINGAQDLSRIRMPAIATPVARRTTASSSSCSCSATPPAVVQARCWRRASLSRPATIRSCGSSGGEPPRAPKRQCASSGLTTGASARDGRTGRSSSTWSGAKSSM